MPKLALSREMRECDRLAMEEFGVPGLTLMENAGRAVVDLLARRGWAEPGAGVLIFVGPGNNGGDALVIARLLHLAGVKPRVVVLADPGKFTGDAAVNLQALQKLPIPLEIVDCSPKLRGLDASLMEADLVVDGIFGTGLSRELSNHFLETVSLINRFPGPVVAVDTPTGLDADSGRVLGAAVRADCTVTFALAKPGLFTWPGRNWAGEVEVVDIGIPQEVYQRLGLNTELLTREELAVWLPPRRPESHKGSFGHLLLLAGSEGKTGAALLAALGALRTGVGLISACVPHGLYPIVAGALWELMCIPLPKSPTFAGDDDLPTLLTALEGKETLVVGPGLGTAPQTAALVRLLYTQQELPMVLDADALNIVARDMGMARNPPGVRVWTPHPGEMARLLQRTTAEVQSRRRESAARLAAEYQVVVVLKGEQTVIADPQGRLAVSPTGNPGMATGGMGDLLAGLIGGLLCQGFSPWQAACLGVFVHGLAGDIMSEESGLDFAFTPSEMADALPEAFRRVTAQQHPGAAYSRR